MSDIKILLIITAAAFVDIILGAFGTFVAPKEGLIGIAYACLVVGYIDFFLFESLAIFLKRLELSNQKKEGGI